MKRQVDANNSGYCYFLEAHHNKRVPAGFFKVGISNNWKNRVKTISKSVPFPELRPVYVIQSPDVGVIEKLILKEFKYARINVKGEWFQIAETREAIGGVLRTQNHRDYCSEFKEEVKLFIMEWVNKNNAQWVMMP